MDLFTTLSVIVDTQRFALGGFLSWMGDFNLIVYNDRHRSMLLNSFVLPQGVPGLCRHVNQMIIIIIIIVITYRAG